MVFEKAAYWIALGVLALFISNQVVIRHESQVGCVADRALTVVERVSSHATQFMARAETMLGRGETHFAQTQAMVACAQTRMASVETVLAQHEAALARVRAERARMEALQQLRTTVICPRQSLRITLPELHGEGTI